MPTSKRERARRAAAASLTRATDFLTHPVFHNHRSETELLRYMRKLADRDLALDRAMIPLGSCTMKLNATTEMIPLTWPEFGALHPFAPREQAAGYHAMFERLEQWLCDITGYDAISLQPNSGAQGEYAGLLAIRAYHAARGERASQCLPDPLLGARHQSGLRQHGRHGGRGRRLRRARAMSMSTICAPRPKSNAENLAAIMITYPSTHGVFEEEIREICDIVHAHGGQVYLDGANLNAQVGLSRPGDYGADVSHLNLHKTFCIPHGGGGPGMGPIGVKTHLAPFLPGHPVVDGGIGAGRPGVGGAVRLGVDPADLLHLHPDDGRRRADAGDRSRDPERQLHRRPAAAAFPGALPQRQGRVAHECIIDPRGAEGLSGVTVDDIAKRLIDYGFHAPTMSFPVAGHADDRADRIGIEGRARPLLRRDDRDPAGDRRDRARHAGRSSDSPLRHAPHTVHDIADDAWTRPIRAREACFPDGVSRTDKYWSPVGRVDNVYRRPQPGLLVPAGRCYAEAAE